MPMPTVVQRLHDFPPFLLLPPASSFWILYSVIPCALSSSISVCKNN